MAGSLPFGSIRTKSINNLKRFLAGDDLDEPLTTRWIGSLLIWLAMLIATPISLWIGGEQSFPWFASLGVAAQFITSAAALAHRWSLRRIAQLSVAVIILSWLVEWIGSTTGFPFGSYDYTGRLQPQIFAVPVLIPFAWLMMLIPSWGVVSILLSLWKGRLGSAYSWVFAAAAGLVFTAWDLYLDPQMVQRGLWVWEQPGRYFGIPLSNYAGWWLSAFLITRLLQPDRLPSRPLLVIYSLTWIFQAIGLGIFWGRPGPAIFGFIGMGIFSSLAWRQVWITSSGRSSDL